jgi:hypothetical protein
MNDVARPSPENALQLQAAIEAHRPQYNTAYGPGGYFYWFLAHHMSAEDVLFADLAPEQNRTVHSARSGRLFVVTPRWFWILDYNDAADEADGTPNQNFGTVDLSTYPREAGTIMSVEWPVRTLRVAQPGHGATPTGVRLDAKTITVNGRGWAVSLPGESAPDADAYFARLRKAIDAA